MSMAGWPRGVSFDAICATLPLGSGAYEPEVNAKSERLIWICGLPKLPLDSLLGVSSYLGLGSHVGPQGSALSFARSLTATASTTGGFLSTEERSGDTTHGSGAANLTGRRAACALRDIGPHELV